MSIQRICITLAFLATVVAMSTVGARAESLVLETGKGDLVRLDRKASSVFVANPSVADVQVKSPRLIYVVGQAVGETTLFAVGPDDRVIVRKTIRVTHNLTALRSAVAALQPKNEITIETVDQSLLIEGTVSSADTAAEVRRIARRFTADDGALINRLEVDGPTQVNLRVRVAEVQRSVTKELGINWNAALSAGDFTFGLTKGALIPDPDLFGGAVDGSVGDLSLGALVNMLAEEGLVSVLAEPNLTAMSGETASFLAGGEFPIPTPGDDGTTTFEFRDFGVSLNFTPTILNQDRISLKVAPEVSELDFANGVTVSGFRIPALSTRRASTTVELGSGQSFAIAGLLQNTSNQSLNKLPGLGDVPVLGALFRSDEYQRGETELVIIVTPYVVEPTSREMATPNQGLLPPNDIDRLLFGRTYGKDTQKRLRLKQRLEQQDLSGSAGFMLE